jgi:hypothetical protein
LSTRFLKSPESLRFPRSESPPGTKRGLLTNKGKGITIPKLFRKGKKGDRMADKNITEVTDENFKTEILDSTVPS